MRDRTWFDRQETYSILVSLLVSVVLAASAWLALLGFGTLVRAVGE